MLRSEVDLTLALGISLLTDRVEHLRVVVVLLSRFLKLILVAGYLVVALLEFTHNLVTPLLDALNLSFLTFNVSLYLRHLCVQLV